VSIQDSRTSTQLTVVVLWSIVTVDTMTKPTSKSVCPAPLASLIEMSNAWAAFTTAKPKDVTAMRQAFMNVSRKHRADADLQQAARVLPDAVRVRMFFTHFGVQPTSSEVLRVLQWNVAAESLLPWPQDEFDRLTRLLSYDGFTSDRLKFCEVCSRIFWAKRSPTRYCERERCRDTFKKREYRKKLRGSK
jgi:hypothetical protein